MKKFVNVLFIVVGFSQFIFSQELSKELKGEAFKKAKIILNDYTKIETGTIRFKDNSAYYFDAYGNQKQIAAKNINYIRYTEGNQKFLGLRIGAVAGTLSGILGSTTYRDYYGNGAAVKDIIISTSAGLVIGSAIGYGIGCFIPKWKTSIVNGNNYTSHIDLKLTPVAFNGAGCSFTYSF